MFAALIERFQDWRERSSAFRELRRQKSNDAPYEAGQLGAIIIRIKTAAFQERVPEALAAWNELRARAPDLAITSATVLRSLGHLKQFDLVESSLAEALTKYPGSIELMQLYAESAHSQGRWEDANHRWGEIRKHSPGTGGGYTFGAIALSQLGHLQDADTLLDHWTTKAPDDIVGATAFAQNAENLGNLPVAIDRWRRMQLHINDVEAWMGEARGLRNLGCVDDAIRILEKARWRFQASPRPSVELALIEQGHCSVEQALERWSMLRRQFPASPAVYVHAAWLLRDLNRRDEAEAILLRYMDRDIADSGPFMEYALLAHGRDWPEACRRWALVRERFPDDPVGYKWGADALDAADEHEQAMAVRAMKP